MKIMFLRVDLHRSKPLISLVTFNLDFHCFQGQGHCYVTIPIVFPANQKQSFKQVRDRPFLTTILRGSEGRACSTDAGYECLFCPLLPYHRSHGVMVSTLDFESSDLSSNLGGTSLSETFISFFCFCCCCCCCLLLVFFFHCFVLFSFNSFSLSSHIGQNTQKSN